MVALTVLYSSIPCKLGVKYTDLDGNLTLPRPGLLLVLIDRRLRGEDLKPHRSGPVPVCSRLSFRHLGEIVLCRSRMVHLLRGDVVEG